MTPMMRSSPAASWVATSLATSTWRSNFLLLLAWEKSTIRRAARPAAAMSLQAASTLAAS